MAQTIAMQRGSGSISVGTSSVLVTLFTQSGGTATRVVFNGFSYACSNTNSNVAVLLRVDQSGGGKYVLGKQQMTAAAATFVPMVTNMYQPVYNGSALSNTAGNFSHNVGGSDYVGTGSPFDTTIRADIAGGGIPQNFWIGPSDAVVLNIQNNSGSFTTNYAYSFTTITES